MYADMDRKGDISLFELTASETESLLHALKHYADYCSNATQLFDYREDLKQEGIVMGKIIRQIESVIHKEESNESRLHNN